METIAASPIVRDAQLREMSVVGLGSSINFERRTGWLRAVSDEISQGSAMSCSFESQVENLGSRLKTESVHNCVHLK